MNTILRISSIIKANNLDHSITGLQTFDLSELNLANTQNFQLPSNIRLGHLVEKIVSVLIKSSTNYNVLYENIQVIEDKKTIGEIDFIIQNIITMQLIHMELAYKFYLFDPSISSELIQNWIGPNRNDSLIEKIDKLKRKQFPLLYHNCTPHKLKDIVIDEVQQALCLLVSLYIPYEYKGNFNPVFKSAIKGYYINIETFTRLDNSLKLYHLPSKKEWGMDPSENIDWANFNEVIESINISIQEKQSLLCWQKHKNSCVAFFIVWW
jgi:hypothetical protein